MPKNMNMFNIICIIQMKNNLLDADKQIVRMIASFLESVTKWDIKRVQVTKLQKLFIFFCIKKDRNYFHDFLFKAPDKS